MDKKTKRKISLIMAVLLLMIIAAGFWYHGRETISKESDRKEDMMAQEQEGETAEEHPSVTRVESGIPTDSASKDDDSVKKDDDHPKATQKIESYEQQINKETTITYEPSVTETVKIEDNLPTKKQEPPAEPIISVTIVPTEKPLITITPLPTQKPVVTEKAEAVTPIPSITLTPKPTITTIPRTTSTSKPTETPVPTITTHICSDYETITKTLTIPQTREWVDFGAFDCEVYTDQVFWCTSCGKSEYDLGYRTYDMETGETIWEDYDGFVDHVHACWAETGKGGSWNDFKQQLINVIHYDHDWGWQIVPEHKETVYGKKCTICGAEYW